MDSGNGVVFVVDDDLSVREALRSLIRSVGLRCETFGSAGEFLAVERPDVPSCLVLDVNLPGFSGLDVPEALVRAGIRIPIVFMTGQGTIPMSVRAMKTGAVEFLTKPFSEQELLAAIDQALERDRGELAERLEHRVIQQRFDQLTERECDVLALVVEGKMNEEIAAILGTAEQTVKQHRGRVMQKLSVRTVPDLMRIVQRHQLPFSTPDGGSP